MAKIDKRVFDPKIRKQMKEDFENRGNAAALGGGKNSPKAKRAANITAGVPGALSKPYRRAARKQQTSVPAKKQKKS
jgi:hypothetical protein